MLRNTFIGLVISVFAFASMGYAEGYSPKIGETLVYKVMIKSAIYGADQTVKIIGKENYKNHEVWRIRYSMDSVGLAKQITQYSEWEEALIDVKGMYPWYIKREVRDKDDLEQEEISFDYEKAVAVRIHSENSGQSKREEIPLPGYVHDGLSLQFFFRNCKFKPGFNKLHFYSNGKIKEVNYDVKEVRENLKLSCGTFSKYYQINNDEIAITVLVADNNERYPLIIRKNAKFGKVEARLERVY